MAKNNLIKSKLKDNRKNITSYAIVIIAYIIFQTLISTGNIKSVTKGLLVPICAYVLMALSLNLTVGILGELSLGHAGFMSVGAFSGVTVAVALQTAVPVPWVRFLIAVVVAVVFAALAGLLIGIPVLRLNGDYLAIVTLAFGEIIKSILNNLYIGIDEAGFHMSMLSDNTNLAEGGKMIIQGPMGIGGIKKISNFTFGAILIIIALVVIFHIINSRYGRAIMAIRDNRIAAESVEINVTKYKLMVFAISAAMAGAAGALFGLNFSTVIANKFGFDTSILVLVFVVLGGLGNMTGSIISATVLTVLPEALRQFSDYRMLVYAIVLIIVMLLKNNKRFMTWLNEKIGALKAKFAKKPAEKGAAK